MEGENHVRAIADLELLRDFDPGGFEILDFGDQRRRVDHQSVADDRLLPGAQDSAGNQLQNEGFVADSDRMAGVMAALIAHHHLEPVRKKIDDLPFSFVSPLGSQYDHITHK